jgi:tetratricopeptide (TPR) repeat protein
MQTLLRITLLAAFLTGLSCAGQRPDVVLITVSGDGALEDATSFGYVAQPDPVLSLAELFTGKMVEARTGDPYRIAADVLTLPEAFKGAGYRTLGFVGYGDIGARAGLFRGFDQLTAVDYPADQPVMSDESRLLRPVRGGFAAARQIADHVAQALKDSTGKGPRFVWVHFGDPAYAAAFTKPDQVLEAHRLALQAVNEAEAFIRESIRTYGSKAPVVARFGLHGEVLDLEGELGHGISIDPRSYRVVAALTGPNGAEEVAGLFPNQFRQRLLQSIGIAPAPTAAAAPSARTIRAPDAARWFGWDLTPGAPQGSAAALSEPQRRLLRGLREARALTLGLREPIRALQRLEQDRELAAGSPGFHESVIRALDSLPPDQRASRRSQLDAALTALQQLAGTDPLRQLDAARAAAAVGRGAQILELLRGLAKSNDAGLRLATAELFVAAASLDEAKELIESVAHAESEAPELFEWLGDLHRATGGEFQAKTAYERAASVPRARSSMLLAKWGDALRALGDHQNALQRYAEALQLAPGYRYPHSQAALSLIAIGKPDEAADAVIKSLAPLADPVISAQVRAETLLRTGLPKAAEIELVRAREQAPDSDALASSLARVYQSAGKVALAVDVLARFVQTHPKHAGVWVELARLHVATGDPAAALQDLQNAQAHAGPGLTRVVRQDPTFQTPGSEAPLAQFARSFQGRGAARGFESP